MVDVESKLKYLMLLKKLIKIKQQKKFESTDENNLEDLRRDKKLEIQRVIDSMSNKEKEKTTKIFGPCELVGVEYREQLKIPGVFRHLCFGRCDAGTPQASINAKPLLHRR